ncbi:hypothetical protein L9F63_021546, partial [Diploptera punctata]
CPNIISKSEWGGRAPASTPQKTGLNLQWIVVHHGGTQTFCYTEDDCAKIVRSYQNYHMDTNGWNDIGYNFVIGEDGNVYEGRGWNAVGAHAPTYNDKSVGICIIGDFTDRVPNDAALNALKSLMQCAVDLGYVIDTYYMIGHRQSSASSTECPGNKLYQEITTWPHWDAIANMFIYVNTESNDCPNIIDKSKWGGRQPTRTVKEIGNNLPYVVIHHGGTKTYCYNQQECSRIVRAYQNNHIDKNRWPDIGYTFLIGEDGNIYEGRGWNTQGAHAPQYNSRSIGICLIGDFTARVPNRKAMDAVNALIQCAVDTGHISKDYKLIGHRQTTYSSTSCPGNSLFAAVQKLPHWTPKP